MLLCSKERGHRCGVRCKLHQHLGHQELLGMNHMLFQFDTAWQKALLGLYPLHLLQPIDVRLLGLEKLLR